MSPIVVLTLAAKAERAANWTDNQLYQVAQELQHELTKVENVGLSYIVGGAPNQIRVEPDPERLSLYGVTLNQLVDKISHANRSFLVGSFRGADSLDLRRRRPDAAGRARHRPAADNDARRRPVYVKDVATVRLGAAQPERLGWTMTRGKDGALDKRPAVSLAIGKRKGANAVVLAEEVLHRLEIVRGRVIPEDLEVSVTRNYGETASDKANEQLFHLALATVSIVALIVFLVGWREGVVVFVIIPTTILLTHVRLLDDGIHHQPRQPVRADLLDRHSRRRRHRRRREYRAPLADAGDRGLTETAIEAVAEVGNPTIVATLTIVAALLPMLFVSGLMGPYMSPIPANASLAMVFSFFVAMTITPWLLMKIAGARFESGVVGEHDAHDPGVMDVSMRASRRDCLRVATARKIPSVCGPRHRGGAGALRHEERARKAAALRQQIRDRRRRRPAARRVAGGDGPPAHRGGGASEGSARTHLRPVLRGHGGAVQFQRAGAALLSARGAQYGRSRRQSPAQRRAQAPEPRHRARHSRAAEEGLPRPETHRDQGRRSAAGTAGASLHCSPKSMAPPPRPRRALATRVRKAFDSVDFIVDSDDSFGVQKSACAIPSIRRRWSFTASRSRRFTTRSRRSSAA